MSGHDVSLAGLYYDGELRGHRLHHFEAHLERCPTCRTELESLYRLRQLLQSFTLPPDRTSPERFAARVRSRLPKSRPQPAWKSMLRGLWQTTPALLFGALTFGQAVFTVSGTVLMMLGLAGGATLLRDSWLVRLALLAGAVLDGSARAVLQLLGTLSWYVLLNLIFFSAIALLYWGWLASWWAYRRADL